MKQKENYSFFDIGILIIFTSIVYFIISMIIGRIVYFIISMIIGRIVYFIISGEYSLISIFGTIVALIIFLPIQYFIMMLYLGFESSLKNVIDKIRNENIIIYYVLRLSPIIINFLLYYKFSYYRFYNISGIKLLIMDWMIIFLTYLYFQLFLKIIKKESPEILE